MASKKRDKAMYIKEYPKTDKWLNQCLICNSIGYKPELPDSIFPGFLAENIRSYFSELEVNEIGICCQCQKHWK